MKLLVAMDSFKGSLSAREACALTADALRQAGRGAWEVTELPLADGGEGTADAIASACNGRMIQVDKVIGPLPDMRLTATYGWLPNKRTAVIEMAAASGLPLLPEALRNPLLTTTFGTGQLIAAALTRGAKHILLTLGGSATVDGGTGAATALGWRFLDQQGHPLQPGGGSLSQLTNIIPPKNASLPSIQALCDVDNPLCGPNGAARVYGPQKGATPAMLTTLEHGLRRLGRLIEDSLGLSLAGLPGAGAAGGFGAGAVAFLNATLQPGFQTVADTVGLSQALRDADWVITGEGRLDEQSLQGKVVSGVCGTAARTGARVAVLAGLVALAPEAQKKAGITVAMQTTPERMSPQEAMQQADILLRLRARQFADQHLGAALH